MASVNPSIVRDLGIGLVMRQANPADIPALRAFNVLVHKDEGVGAIVDDLTGNKHPTMTVGDFTLVEDTSTGAIVSSLCLIPQTWTYAGVPFGVGQVELVGTHSDYRNRGLMRAQMQAAHQWSAERGQPVQVITGIPFYYRQFGYEMCVNLQGWHGTQTANVPALPEGQTEPYRVRPVTEADLGLIAELYDAGCKRSLLACERDAARWRYDLTDISEKNLERRTLCFIEDTNGKPVGYLAHRPYIDYKLFMATAYELAPGISWRAVTPSVLRYLVATGSNLAAQKNESCERVGLELGETHPAYDAMLDSLPIHRKPYAWYMRVADCVGFLRQIKPELERRLAASVVAGHSGELKIGFYTDGVRLVFERGFIVEIDRWKPSTEAWGHVTFPGLTFLQVLFGYRTLSEVRHAFADCFTTSDEAQVLINALFVKQASNVWAVT